MTQDNVRHGNKIHAASFFACSPWLAPPGTAILGEGKRGGTPCKKGSPPRLFSKFPLRARIFHSCRIPALGCPIRRRYAAANSALSNGVDVGLLQGYAGLRRGTRSPRGRLLRLGLFPGRRAATVVLALAFLIGALAPAWHRSAAQPRGGSAEMADLAAALGEPIEALPASICHHDQQDLPGAPPADGKWPGKNPCPLCQALQLSGHALAHNRADFPPPVRFFAASLAPNGEARLSAPFLAGEERSRAPPAVCRA